MENLPELIYFKDRECRFTRANRALARRFGCNEPAQLNGKCDFDFFTEEHARQAYTDELQLLRGQIPIWSKEEKETWPDGGPWEKQGADSPTDEQGAAGRIPLDSRS